MVRIDARKGPRWLFVPNTSVLAYYSARVFHQGAAACLTVRIAQV